MSKDINFSVCMSVYHGDNAEHFDQSLNSVFLQTPLPNEVVLVVDGPIGYELNNVIKKYERKFKSLRVIRLSKNSGHAVARQTGLSSVQNNLVAIMDSDDISLPGRFMKQLYAFEKYPHISVIGGIIDEFVNTPDNVVGSRIVPQTDEDIKEYMKSRCPMNLVTVMLKKDDVLKVGGFIDWYCEEDYYLWLRLAMAGYKFHNIQEKLVKVRVGKDMYARRGGIKYFKSETRLQKYMLDNNIISFTRFSLNVFVRLCVQVLMPNWLRGWTFRTLARK